MNTDLDAMYYRNRDIIANQGKCSNYKFLRNYSACSEEQVKATVVVEEKKTPAKPAAPAPAAAAAPAAPTAETYIGTK